jgi:hypothetical protein
MKLINSTKLAMLIILVFLSASNQRCVGFYTGNAHYRIIEKKQKVFVNVEIAYLKKITIVNGGTLQVKSDEGEEHNLTFSNDEIEKFKTNPNIKDLFVTDKNDKNVYLVKENLRSINNPVIQLTGDPNIEIKITASDPKLYIHYIKELEKVMLKEEENFVDLDFISFTPFENNPKKFKRLRKILTENGFKQTENDKYIKGVIGEGTRQQTTGRFFENISSQHEPKLAEDMSKSGGGSINRQNPKNTKNLEKWKNQNLKNPKYKLEGLII